VVFFCQVVPDSGRIEKENPDLYRIVDFCTARQRLRNLYDPTVDLDGLRIPNPLSRGI
jgi:hypothetical protein